MGCGNDIVKPDEGKHECPPIGFKKNKVPLGNNEMEVVVYCYTGGNHIRNFVPAGVFTLSKKETQEEVDAACRAFYEASLRLELDCDQPQFYTFEDSAELGILPPFIGAFVGGTWFNHPYPDSGQANTLPGGALGLNEPFYLPINQNCLLGDPPPPPIVYYCPANTPSLTVQFDTRPPNWATRGSFSLEIPLFENYDFHPVFGNFSVALHSFFQGASSIPTADPDEAYSQSWAARVPLTEDSGTLRLGHTAVGPELFSAGYTTVTGYEDVLPKPFTSVCQGHDGDLYIATQSDNQQITLKSALTGTYNWVGDSPRMFTSRVFTGRQSTSETYCFYLNEAVSSSKIFARSSADGFSTEIEVLDFPAPIRFLQDVARVGDRLVMWAMTRGPYRRDIHQIVLFSAPWEDESIKKDFTDHEATVSSGTLEKSVFEPVEGGIQERSSETVSVSFGELVDDGTKLVRDTVRHYGGVVFGTFAGELSPLSFTELSDHAVGVVRGIRHSASAAVLDHVRHRASVQSGELV